MSLIASSGSPESGYGRRTVSMPRDLIAGIEKRVGSRGFSAYVTAAVQRQLQRDNLADLVEWLGPVDEEGVARVEEEIRQILSDVT